MPLDSWAAHPLYQRMQCVRAHREPEFTIPQGPIYCFTLSRIQCRRFGIKQCPALSPFAPGCVRPRRPAEVFEGHGVLSTFEPVD
eukprot:636888-Prorocentrum_minimum.AAC.5